MQQDAYIEIFAYFLKIMMFSLVKSPPSYLPIHSIKKTLPCTIGTGRVKYLERFDSRPTL